jgi:hypothetical protein
MSQTLQKIIKAVELLATLATIESAYHKKLRRVQNMFWTPDIYCIYSPNIYLLAEHIKVTNGKKLIDYTK